MPSFEDVLSEGSVIFQYNQTFLLGTNWSALPKEMDFWQWFFSKTAGLYSIYLCIRTK